ncbi:DUF748 domain-containing protein [Halioglobus maricola]|uniref:DUF748 domain-containing protein n=1 Tax=Halioglobus maricola TaxID=2601894 RepID=UPI00197A7A94|nr:DUF748 domain-containing protein [Halioglobus maricola]
MVRVLVGAYIAWIALSVLIILPAVNFIPPWFVKEQYGRTLSSDITLFNPFTLSIEMRNAELRQPDGGEFATLDQALVNLSLRTLISEGLVLDEVALRGLNLEVRQVEPGVFNFSDLLASDDSSPSESDAELMGITVRKLSFTAERITLIDEAREQPFQTHYDGLSIAVKDLSTIAEEGKPYQIDVYAEAGGSLHWKGSISVPLAESEGWLAIRDLSLAPAWRFARPWLNFDLIDGRAGMEGNYYVSWRDELSYRVNDTKAELVALELRPRDPTALPDTGVQLARLDITGVTLDSAPNTLDIESITADKLQIDGWSEGEQLSLADMFATNFPETETDAAESEQDADASPLQVSVATLDLTDSGANWRSEYTSPPTLKITPLSASLANLNWPFSGASPAGLDLTLNDTASLAVNGDLTLADGGAQIDYKLSSLPLSWFNPTLPAALKAQITSGAISVEGNVELHDFAPTQLKLGSKIENFSGKIAGAEEAITRWDEVRFVDLAIDLPGREASLQQLFIHNYAGRVHIAEDGSVNASKVWQEEVGEQAQEIADELDLDKPWDFSVPEILISDSAVDFMDESLPIPFRTIIGDVNGQVLNINSAPDAETHVDIKGSVDGYAPVELVGTASPFNTPPDLDLVLTFDGVDLVLLTPYSGTYAGYAIERGLLNLKLEYSLQKGHIEGDNEVLIDQLKLGEKVDSDKAVDLPLELALALLTDINGVIDLQVPVEGDIDDPEFAIGGVIAKAFMNLITKAVTAPFSLLANLVGSEQDLQRLGFAPGERELNEGGQAKLDTLAEALRQRPGLTLVVIGSVHPDADTEKLQLAVLVQELIDEGFTQADIDRRAPEVIDTVKARYVTLYGSPPEDMTLTDQYRRVLASIQIDPGTLRDLATDRAAATKEYLVNQQGLPADRAVVEVADNLDNEEAFSGVLMDLVN